MFRIGIDMGGTKIEGVIMAPDGAITARQRVATPQDYESEIRTLKQLVESLETQLPNPALVGVCHPGSFSPATGLMRNANSTWLNGKSLKSDLEAALRRDIKFANDADCFAVSEAKDGAGASFPTVFGVIIGTGTGGGIVKDGHLHTGPSAIAGEWGHIPLPWPSVEELSIPPCWCGLQGCLETWLSGTGLSADHARHTKETLKGEEIVARAQNGDPHARESLNRHADRMARGLAVVLNILDPDCVVLGGGLSNIPDLPAAIEARLARYVFSDTIKTVIRRAHHGDSSGVRGAAWLWPLEGSSPQ